MVVFNGDSKGVVVWGPTASVEVKVDAFGDVVDDSWLLCDMTLNAREIVDVRQCFNEVAYIYALGNDQANCQMTLSFVIFLGAKNCLKGRENTVALEVGLKDYIKNRISKHTDPLNITIGSLSRKAWLHSVRIGNLDASKSVCYGTLAFIMQLEDK